MSAAWTEAEYDRAREMWNAYATQDQIAEAMGKTDGSVAFHLTKMGLRGRKPKPGEPLHRGRIWNKEDDGCLRQMWGDGKSEAQIGELLGRAPTAIRNRASAIGLIGGSKITKRILPADVAPLPVRRELPLVPPARTCQYIFGEPAGRDFCGKKSVPGISYCAEHGAICLIPLVPRIGKEAAF